MLQEGQQLEQDILADSSRTRIHKAKMLIFKYLDFGSIGFHRIRRYLSTKTSRRIIDKAVLS
jgi:hypothetical protein